MRRFGNLWSDIVRFDALASAAQRAARGKRRVHSVARFLERLEPEVLHLQRELCAGTWRPGTPHTFEIRDPKPRLISAAPFPDRVVHHALMARLAPVFERRMVFESFACREGKGTHAALRHARSLLRRHARFLKLDVRRFFPSLRHDVVLAAVERTIKDHRAIALCRTILAGPLEKPNDTGLPIGNLTSQWFANLVLDRLDHFVKQTLRAPGYVRFMDDFVLFANDHAQLQDSHAAIADFLADTLSLELKPTATILAPATEGLPFLGFRLYRGTTRIRPESLRRIRRRLRRRHWQFASGLIDEERFLASVRAMTAHMQHGATLGLRRRMLANIRDPCALA